MMRIGLYPKMKPNFIFNINEPLFEYTAVYFQPKFLDYKIKQIHSYSALYGKHQSRVLYSSIYLSTFAQDVANNYAGLGDIKNLLKWTRKSIYTNPYRLTNYYKPLFIFIKRKIMPYPQ
jgi:hypothetical protein